MITSEDIPEPRPASSHVASQHVFSSQAGLQSYVVP